jgi:hypothetical protein
MLGDPTNAIPKGGPILFGCFLPIAFTIVPIETFLGGRV